MQLLYQELVWACVEDTLKQLGLTSQKIIIDNISIL